MTNTLYYGDNLRILRDHVKDESVDLIYLDPPFNSNASYNILFKEQSGKETGKESAAQIKAFEDTWHWGPEAESAFAQIMESPLASATTKKLVGSLRETLGDKNDMTAYLVMMAVRLLELHRVLKPTGSLYLHCDPTASHYLKILLDAVFGPTNFRNEIVWKRNTAHSDAKQGSKHYGRINDNILFYSKSANYTWNHLYQPYDEDYVKTFYSNVEPETGRRFQYGDLTGPGGAAKGNPEYEFLGVTRYWRYSKEQMERLYKEGRIVFRPGGGVPRLKRYLDEAPGVPLQTMWTDIRPLINFGKEALGYATQKPLALLERIIAASSIPGDVVLDPFCGCGTAVAAAQKLGRQWTGIDVTHLAVALMKSRLKDMFALEPGMDYQVVGEPADEASARQLWQDDPYQFQYWAVSLVTGQPRQREKRGPDRGIDGVIFFLDGPRRTAHQAIIQVKGGKVSSPQVRDLKGVVEREKAALGLFICLEEPTRDMRTEAVSGGFFHSDLMGKDYPRVQLRTVAELLSGKPFDMPLRPVQFKQAERVRKTEGEQGNLALG